MIKEIAKRKTVKTILANKINESTKKSGTNWDAVYEYVIVTTLIVLLTNLLSIGRIPTIEELYIPCVGALLAGLYAYGRIRGLDIQEPE